MEELLDGIAEMLRDANLGYTVHWGNPQLNPQWDLPYISISPTAESERPWTTGKNLVETSIDAFIVVSAMSNFSSFDTDSPVDRELVKVTERVKNILRSNVTVGGRVFMYERITVQYRSGIKGGEGIRVAQLNVVYSGGRSR